jgi:hypothetical protein
MLSKVYVYRVCDLILGSAVPLPELSPASDVHPEWMFRPHRHRPLASAVRRWSHHVPAPDGTRFLSADFAISLRHRTIDCSPTPRTPFYTLRHLLLDHVIPLVLSTQRKLVLHASAVLGPGGVLAFMGPTGSGKSTLGLSLARHGCPVVADDFLLLHEENGRWVAVPSYEGVRLWPETVSELLGEGSAVHRDVSHYTAKQRLGAHSAWRLGD